MPTAMRRVEGSGSGREVGLAELARHVAFELASAANPMEHLAEWAELAADAVGAPLVAVLLVHRRSGSGYLLTASTDPYLKAAHLNAAWVGPAGLMRPERAAGVEEQTALRVLLREHLDVAEDLALRAAARLLPKDCICWAVAGVPPDRTPPSEDDLSFLAALFGLAARQSQLLSRLAEHTKRVRTPSSLEVPSLEVMARYGELFNVASDGVLILDRKGRIQYANRVAEAITGFSSNWLAGREVDVLLGEADARLLRESLEDVFAGRIVSSLDLTVRTTSEDVRYVNASVNVLPGTKHLVVVTFQDMTDTRVVEEELYWTTEFLERLIQSAVDAILYCDPDGVIQLFNTGAEQLFERASEDVVGQVRIQDLFPEGEAQRLLELLRSPKKGGVGRLQPVESVALARDGQRKAVQLTGALVLDGDQELGMLFIISDQTDTVRLRKQYMEVRERLLEREKEALIAQLAGATAHELNQPLTSIIGYAEILKRRLPDDPQAKKAADVIIAEAERMAEIVRKIGRITRYETKQYVGSAEILDLDKSVEED